LLEGQLQAGAAPETNYPLTLTDGLGREVTIQASPQRIVSLLPSNTEILFALGLGDQVVGVTEYDTYPPEAQTKQVIGGMTVNTISLETILALEPDLVLAHDELQRPAIDALVENGLTVFATNTQGLDDIYRTIGWIGQIAGVQDRADTLSAEIQEEIAAISAQIDAVPADRRPNVFYEVWSDPLLTAGPQTYIGELISLAGAKNIFDDVTQDFPEVSAEEVIARNPDVILSAEYNGEYLSEEALATRPGWSQISAVKNGRVYLLSDDLISRPGSRVALGMREIVKVLYPGLLAEE
jgi:iron complex transport system substrate-binding protein